MSCTSLPLQSLPFPELFKDYLSQNPALKDFFSASPFSDDELGKRIKEYQFQGDRVEISRLLKTFNHQFKPADETLLSIKKLEEKNSLAVVTGQQLTVYGGPLLTIYKTLTAISLAKKWQKKYNRPVIPVFWLADEDHDYDEVSSIGIPGSGKLNEFSLGELGKGSEAAGDLLLNSQFESFRDSVANSIHETDFSDSLWKLLDDFYTPGESLKTAFGRLLLNLFGKHGLVLAGSNDPAIKKRLVQPMQHSIHNYREIYKSLNQTTESLIKKGYHGQVQVQESNLFWIDEKHQRRKINVKNEQWVVEGNGKEWTAEALCNEIENKPHQFSPNVFMRPVIQDTILPAITYIAGPGEVSYYAQMKQFYRCFSMQMPVVFPRFSATILESGIDRIMDKLPFSFSDYTERIEDLESKFVRENDPMDIDTLFENWKKRTDDLTKEIKQRIGDIDPTLEGSAGKAKAVYYSELDKLKGKTYRSLKQQEKIQLKRIRKIQQNIFPDRNMQERKVAFIYFMNKYGIDIWDTVLNYFESEIPDSHKVIRL